jgi:creatinine amidohydrolase
MLWMELTSERFGRAIEESEGVCLLPIGCIERHGPHLPLGCDTITVEAIARRAAEQEPVVVFPALYLSQIAEARHEPGCISLDHALLLRLLRAALDEIGRNGFSKILIFNGHGGNTGLIGYLIMSMLQERHSYVLLEDFTDPADAESRGWLKHLTGAHNSFGWYSDHPTHIAGDPSEAAAEKGEFLLEAAARSLVRTIREVKADDVSARLAADFYNAAERGGQPLA